VSEPLYCINHPKVETYLRCNRCGAPICPRCAVRTEVGYRCRTCISRQQQVFYADFRPVYYLVAVLVALPLGLAGLVIPLLGWFVIFLGPLMGLVVAEAVRWATSRRRGPYTWLVAAACVLLGGLPRLVLDLSWWQTDIWVFVWAILWDAVYLIGAVGTTAARLRGRQR